MLIRDAMTKRGLSDALGTGLRASRVGGRAFRRALFRHALIRRAWHLRWLWLLNGFLLSPLFLYDAGLWTTGGNRPDKLLLFSLPASVLTLTLIHLFVRRAWLAHMVLIPVYFLAATDVFLIVGFEMRLTSSMLSVIIENGHLAGDYLRSHAERIVPSALGLLAFTSYGILKLREVELGGSPRSRAVVAVGLAGLYGAVAVRQVHAAGNVSKGLLDVVSHDRSIPLGFLAQGYTAHVVYEQAKQHQLESASFVFGARRKAPPAVPETYVLVLGESARPDHWGLYGYHRQTTPNLTQEPNLIPFTSAISQAAVTKISVPLILTRANVGDRERAQREKSIISAYHEVGFKTFWMSTQQRDQWTGAVNHFSTEADVQRYFERQNDHVLVRSVRRRLASSDHRSDDLFFVLHTQGSHFVFEDRYPPEYEKYPTDGAGLSANEAMVNAYDNTVAYTDWVLRELIDALRDRGGPAALLYVADHGENLRDDARQLFGHFLNNEYDLPIPMVLWYSDSFQERYPEKVAAARANASRPITTQVAFYTLADLADIVVDDEEGRRSLLSPALEDGPRQVLRHWQPVDFDEWIDTEVCPDAPPWLSSCAGEAADAQH